MNKEQIRDWWNDSVSAHSITQGMHHKSLSLSDVMNFLLDEADEKERLEMVNESLRDRIAALEALK